VTNAKSYLCAGVAALAFTAAVHLHPLFAWCVGGLIALGIAGGRGWRHDATFGAVFAAMAVTGAHAAWVSAAAGSYFDVPAPAAALAATLAMLVPAVALGSALGLLSSAAVALGGPGAALAIGCVWVLWESSSTAVIPYYPWASLAVTQADWPTVLQIAAWLGQAAVSFVVAAAGAALGLAVVTPGRRARVRLLLSAAAIVLPVLAFGHARLARSAPAGTGPTCSLRAIDAAIPSGRLPREDVLRRYESATEKALEPRPDAVVWPESALPASPEIDAALRRRLRDDARHWGAVLVAGGPGIAWGESWEPKIFNSVYRIGATGPLERYDKRRLVPFAEYWPLPVVRRPRWLSAEETQRGGDAAIFSVGACRLGVLICFEGESAELAGALVRAGADGLLVLSNDAHLSSVAARLEVAQLRLRAVETGVGIVRAANHGTSAVIDRNGRLVESAPPPALFARLPALASGAPALRWGGLFRLLCHAGALAAVGWSVVRQRRLSAGRGEQSLSKLSR
jgi:apolipoprotein N-acyltransferase